MSRYYYRSIWISDIHLGTKHVNSEYLLDFLKMTNSEYLYLVGDIIDFWKLQSTKYWPNTNNHIIRNILKKARNGTKVIYIPGNHDEIMREYDGQNLYCVTIANTVIHQTASGQNFLVTHGDEFDCVIQKSRWLALLGSMAYELLLESNTLVNIIRSALDLPYWSLSACLKAKIKKIVNFISHYETEVAQEAVRRKVDGFICGHIHQAASKTINGIIYKNIGDWVENCTALTENGDGSLNLISWTGKVEKIISTSEAYENCYSDRRLAPTG